MDSLHDLKLFLAIVEEGSQTAAARRHGCSLQAVNRSIAKLERELGVELVSRTTRRSVVTEAGSAFYERVKPAIEIIREAEAEAMDRRAQPAGLLRVASPRLFGAEFIVPAVAEYRVRHPEVAVHLALSDDPVDIVGGGFDVSIRMRHLPDSTLVARRIGRIRVVTFASPDYLRRRGRPASPEELRSHDCIRRTPAEERWPFRMAGTDLGVPVRGGVVVDDATASRAAALAGLGIARGPHWQVHDLVEAGALELLLVDHEPPPLPVSAVLPPGRLRPAKTTLFLDVLKERFRARPGLMLA